MAEGQPLASIVGAITSWEKKKGRIANNVVLNIQGPSEMVGFIVHRLMVTLESKYPKILESQAKWSKQTIDFRSTVSKVVDNQLFCTEGEAGFWVGSTFHPNDRKLSFNSLSKVLRQAAWYQQSHRKELSIVILTLDNIGYIKKLLSSVSNSIQDIDYEVVIISNCKKPETIGFLREELAAITGGADVTVAVVKQPFNFAQYCNLGARLSRGKRLLFLNDDMVVTRRWAAEMLDVLDSDSDVGVVGAKILFFDEKLQHMGIGLAGKGDWYAYHPFVGESEDLKCAQDFREMDAVTGACLMTDRKLLLEMGGFDESYVDGYFEDTDICMRMKKLGKKVIYCPKAVVYHHLSASFQENFAESYYKNCDKFKETWGDKVEDNMYRFVSSASIYQRKATAVVQDSFLMTVGGGERVAVELTTLCNRRMHTKMAIFNEDLNFSELKNRVKTIMGKEFSFPIIRRQTDVDCDLFINHEWASEQPGLGKTRNVLFVMFPHQPSNTDFLGTYDTIVANSKYTAHWVQRYWNRKAEVIYPIVDMVGCARPKRNLILGVGRFFSHSHSKKQQLLIRQFKELDLPGWKLILCGGLDKSYDDNIEYFDGLQKEIGTDKRITLLPNISRNKLLDLYRQAKIFWHAAGYGENDPAHSEHFGIVVAEAQSAGCVPVVVRKGGLVEIVNHGENGLTWRTLEEWRKFTLSLVEDKELLEKLSKAAVISSQKFGKRQFGEQVRKLLWEGRYQK